MYGFVITTAGESLLARASAQQPLTIPGVRVGSGGVSSATEAKALTALVQDVAAGTSGAPAVSGGQVSLLVEYRNDLGGGLGTGFTLREFGVFARVGDDQPTLLYYADLGDNAQTVLPESQGLDVHRFPVAWAITDGVTVTLDYPAGAFITSDEMTEAMDDYIPTSQKGAAGGVATLDDDGKVPDEQLPEMDYLPLAGGTMEGDIYMGEHVLYTDRLYPHTQGGAIQVQGSLALGQDGFVSNLVDPTAPDRAARKAYVDRKTVYYGTSGSLGGAGTKAVTLTDAAGFALVEGQIIGVWFDATNTSSSVRLNVNNTGAAYVYQLGGGALSEAAQIVANYWHLFRYSNGRWYLLNPVNTQSDIVFGSYVGTGTYDVVRPNSLEFGFRPKVLIIQEEAETSCRSVVVLGDCAYSYMRSAGNANGSTIAWTWSDTGVSWYAVGGLADDQLNEDGVTYRYVAIG